MTAGLPEPPRAAAPFLPADAFAGRTVLIAGASPLGAAIGEALTRCGAVVAVLRAVDPCDPACVSAAFDAAEARHGPVTLLVNAATPWPVAQAADVPFRAWRQGVADVLDAAFLCCTEFARRRIAEQRGGAVLNLTESFLPSGAPGLSHAASAGGGIVGLTRTLAVEWAAHDIRVNALAAGPCEGGVLPVNARSLPAMRPGQPHEIGWAGAFLLSDYAAYMTGAVLPVDGGDTLRRTLLGPELR